MEDIDKALEFNPTEEKRRNGVRTLLTPRMIHACELYIEGKSLYEAMITAGYKESYAKENKHQVSFLKTRGVIAYLRKRLEENAETYEINQKFIMRHAKKILQDNNPRDRTIALQMLERMTQPRNPDTLKKEDLKSITLNFEKLEKPVENE